MTQLRQQIEMDFTAPVYFDTLGLSEEKKRQAEIAAKKGNDVVMLIFNENPTCHFTPRHVHLMLLGRGYTYELNSVRRSITVLTDAKLLKKNPKELQKKECKGANNFTWKLNTDANR